MERRRRNRVVNREPPVFFLSWTGEQLDIPTRGLFSRVMGAATPSRTAMPHAEVSLKRDGTLPVSCQSAAPLSVRVSSLTNLSVISFGKQFFSSLWMLSSWETWVSTLVATTSSQHAWCRR